MRIRCSGTKPDGSICRQVLGAYSRGEFVLQHRGRGVVLRGMLVSGSISCESCGEVRYLNAVDFGEGVLTPAHVDEELTDRQAA